MKHHISHWYAPALGLVVAFFAFANPDTIAAGNAVTHNSTEQAGLVAPALAAPAAGSSAGWLSGLAGLDATGELAQRTGNTAQSAESSASLVSSRSPVLGEHPALGPVAAPITRFRDGGHAYYLFNAGLHSCSYVGKCMDLFAPIGEPVYAMADGVVSIPKYAPGSYGHYLKIKFRDGSKAIYAHLNEISVVPGPVTVGTQIGAVGCSGTTGESNNCKRSEQHLHLEWNGLKWKPGQYGQLPPYFTQWRGEPLRCFKGCGPDQD